MKSKAFFLALSCFVFSATFAQDSPKTPKPDTTKWPKHDSTTVKDNNMQRAKAAGTVETNTSFMMINENKLAAKKEVMNDITI